MSNSHTTAAREGAQPMTLEATEIGAQPMTLEATEIGAQPMTLEATEAECAAGRTAPRVSLADIEGAIMHRYDITGADAVRPDDGVRMVQPSLLVLSICILLMRNGFTIIGKAAPASPANFDRALGIKLAYEDAVRQVWPLMGYALCEKLTHERY